MGEERSSQMSLASVRFTVFVRSVLGLALVLLAVGASNFLMIDQGDYPRTVSRIVAAPEEAIQLPYSQPVGQRWLLDPLADARPNLSSGSASMAFYALALLQKPLGAYDVRLVGWVFSLIVGLGIAVLASLLARRLGAESAVATALGTLAALPLVLAAHNSAFLTSFYGEFAFIVAAPWLLVALLMPPSRWRSVLLFASVAVASLAKAQNVLLPALILGMWGMGALVSIRWRSRAASAEGADMRRSVMGFRAVDIAGLLAAQMMALVMVAKGDYGHYNAHHAAFLGAYYYVSPGDIRAQGLVPPPTECIGVDRWGNRLSTASDLVPDSAPPACLSLGTIQMGDVLRLHLASPTVLLELAADSLPVHATVDYFHVLGEARYIHAVDPNRATRFLQAVSAWRDAVMHGFGVVIAPFMLLLLSLGLACGRYRALSLPLAVLATYALSQVGVSLLGEGVRDLSKHLAMAQYAIDLGLAMVLITAAILVSRLVTSAARGASTRSSRARSGAP